MVISKRKSTHPAYLSGELWLVFFPETWCQKLGHQLLQTWHSLPYIGLQQALDMETHAWNSQSSFNNIPLTRRCINYSIKSVLTPSNQSWHYQTSPHTSKSVPTPASESSHHQFNPCIIKLVWSPHNEVNPHLIKSVITLTSQSLHHKVSSNISPYATNSVPTPSTEHSCPCTSKSVFTPTSHPTNKLNQWQVPGSVDDLDSVIWHSCKVSCRSHLTFFQERIIQMLLCQWFGKITA